MEKEINIKKSKVADINEIDTKTSDDILEATEAHIEDVRAGIRFFISMLRQAGIRHDETKLSDFAGFSKYMYSKFKDEAWWLEHQDKGRHHLYNADYVQDDVNLIDVLEQISDSIMASMARDGTYIPKSLSPELLSKAYENTVRLLLDVVNLEK